MISQATLRFPGLQQVVRWSFTLSHGVAPGVANIDIAPQFGVPAEIGTLEIRFVRNRLRFTDCAIDHALVRRDPRGMIVGLTLLDRRWKWRFGEISSRYNLRTRGERLDEATEKTPQELATLLLMALGESGFSVDELPNQTRPEVDWVAANPAGELAALCDALGCRIVLGLDDRVSIRRIGAGAELPNLLEQRTQTFGIDPPARPDSLKVVGGPTRFQTKFRLEAVGLDSDGSIVPIDQLDYVPAEGWSTESPAGFPNLASADARARAAASVYRWYRIKCTAPDNTAGTFRLPGDHGSVSDLWQLLPLEPGLVDTERGPDGIERAQPPIVEGIFWPGSPDGQNVPASRRYDRPFEIDAARGIVQFAEPVVKRDATNDTFAPAELYLTIGHLLYETDSRQELRFTDERPVPAAPTGAGVQILRRDDLVQTIVTRYSDTHNPTAVETNQDQLASEAAAALEAGLAALETRETAQAEYAGIVPISPDGAIYQVVWSGSPDGAVTHAGRLVEFATSVPAYAERQSLHAERLAEEESRRVARATARLLRSER